MVDSSVNIDSLGYSSSPGTDLPAATALHVTRPRKQDRRQRKVTRSVFLCYVLGATGSGKTSLLRSFVNKGFRGSDDGSGGYEPTTKVASVVNSVEMEGVEKYLVVSLLLNEPNRAHLPSLSAPRVRLEIRERDTTQ